MSARPIRGRDSQAGVVLVTALLLMVVVTIIALSMFRSFGIQERIAGNLREKLRALHSAENAQHYAEYWLTTANNAASTPVVCNSLLNANLGQGQVCSNSLAAAAGSAVTVPWTSTGNPIGVAYTPPGMTVSATVGAGTYLAAPKFYIAFLGASASGAGNAFKVDAFGYGGTASAVAVVESTYEVSSGVVDRGAL